MAIVSVEKFVEDFVSELREHNVAIFAGAMLAGLPTKITGDGKQQRAFGQQVGEPGRQARARLVFGIQIVQKPLAQHRTPRQALVRGRQTEHRTRLVVQAQCAHRYIAQQHPQLAQQGRHSVLVIQRHRRQGRPILLKGGCVLSLDKAVGDFEQADVLVLLTDGEDLEQGGIRTAEARLAAADAVIAPTAAFDGQVNVSVTGDQMFNGTLSAMLGVDPLKVGYYPNATGNPANGGLW